MNTPLAKLCLVWLFTGLYSTTLAQKYGGSAYVHLKDTKGNTRVINATSVCEHHSEPNAKSGLQVRLNNKKKYNEEFDSPIYYSIDRCKGDGTDGQFGGSASARVQNRQGSTRTITATLTCTGNTRARAKVDLETSLNNKKKYDEEYISGISYDIDECN